MFYPVIDSISMMDNKPMSLKNSEAKSELLEIKGTLENIDYSIIPLLKGHGVILRFLSPRNTSHFPVFFFPDNPFYVLQFFLSGDFKDFIS